MGQNPPALRFSWSHVEDVLHEVLPGDSDTDDDEMTPEDDIDLVTLPGWSPIPVLSEEGLSHVSLSTHAL